MSVLLRRERNWSSSLHHLRIQRADGHLQVRKWALIRHLICQPLDLERPASRAEKTEFLLFLLQLPQQTKAITQLIFLFFLSQNTGCYCPSGSETFLTLAKLPHFRCLLLAAFLTCPLSTGGGIEGQEGILLPENSLAHVVMVTQYLQSIYCVPGPVQCGVSGGNGSGMVSAPLGPPVRSGRHFNKQIQCRVVREVAWCRSPQHRSLKPPLTHDPEGSCLPDPLH